MSVRTPAPAQAELLAGRLRLALAMFEDGVGMKRLSLRRQHPHDSEQRLRERLRSWLRNHPDGL